MLQRRLLAHHAFRQSAPTCVRRVVYPILNRLNTAFAHHHRRSITTVQHADQADTSAIEVIARKLPITCPGCGALSQTIEPELAGYYGPKRKQRIQPRKLAEDAIFASAVARGAIEAVVEPPAISKPESRICDRCAQLVNQSSGTSIIHPSTDSIRSIIEDSPHRYNHIYHIIDAADFPLSMIKNLQSALRLPRFRTQNRRSKTVSYISGRVAEVSFIITRSDLLAPQKEQVDRLYPYMQNVLRDALSREHKNIRLGNLMMVSSKRGWWTKDLKEDIYRRGGGGWMVGKVNVGKSALVEVVYPKGRMRDGVDMEKVRVQATQRARQENVDALSKIVPLPGQMPALESFQEVEVPDNSVDELDNFTFDESNMSLLPPKQPEEQYPTMPIVSALPGTTASPIRLPFGSGRGELIDMPGIERSMLELYVKEEHRKGMILKHRVVPEQQVIKPGQSLLLGGLIRITPKTENLTFLAYAFLPASLSPHLTSTDKAIAIQTGSFSETGEAYTGHVESHATDEAKSLTRHAGTFSLQWDVTKQRAGPVTAKAGANIKVANLPFTVYAMDLLIEGVGWVEIVAQVRRKQDQALTATFPEIEVFTPQGKFVGSRQPMNAWLIGGRKKKPVHSRRPRPRQSISYHKRMEGGRRGSEAKRAQPNF